MEIDAETQLTVLKRRVGDDAVVLGVLHQQLQALAQENEQLRIEVTALKSAAVESSQAAPA